MNFSDDFNVERIDEAIEGQSPGRSLDELMEEQMELEIDPGIERWRPIPGFRHYLVSDLGRVFSFISRRLMNPSFNCDGYKTTGFKKNGKIRSMGVHQLVLMGFVGVCPEGYEVNHIDHIRSNNRLENLEFVTKSQNQIDKISYKTDFTFVSSLPNDAVEFKYYNGHEFNGYYISGDQLFQKIRDDRFRVLDVRKKGKSDYYNLMDVDRKSVRVSLIKLRNGDYN